MKHYLAPLLLLFVIITGCSTADQPLSACDLAPCDPKKPTVKATTDQEGRIGFSQEEGRWLIITSIPGTYDVQDIGIGCTELPENFQEVGREVLFSGTYKEKCDETKGVLPGQTYYYLHLTEVAKL